MQIASSPVYLDSSALAKLHVAASGSATLEAALVGRRDLIVSELAVTELSSAIARRTREGDCSAAHPQRLYQRIQRDRAAGQFRRAELTASVHREAERMLLGLGRRVPLRAADALHLVLAAAQGAQVLLTFDTRMPAAAEATGTFQVPA